MGNNPWFRVKVHSLGDEIWFEHPTQVDNRHSIDKSAPLNPQNEELHLLPNGNLASPGWMERMVEDVRKVYAPGKPEDLDMQAQIPAQGVAPGTGCLAGCLAGISAALSQGHSRA